MKLFKSIFFRCQHYYWNKIVLNTNISFLRNKYWNKRANDIHNTWGNENLDFKVLKKIISDIEAKSILDIGCGSGRLLPLYQHIGDLDITGQDISKKAIQLFKKRFTSFNQPKIIIHTVNKDLLHISNNYDLIISNRVLAAILTSKISMYISHLCSISDHIYINEPTDADYTNKNSNYWFKHEYLLYFQKNGFHIKDTGKINQQEWFLFSKN